MHNSNTISFLLCRFLRNQLFLSYEKEISYFYEFHSPTHMNTGNYIVGLLIGVMYHESKDKMKLWKKSWKLELLWHLSWIAGYAISILGFPFYELNFEKSIITALFGAFMKHYHGLLLGITLLGVIMRYGLFIPKIFNLPVFRVMGRISYSFFLCHICIMKLFMTNATQPLEFSMANTVNLH